MISAEVLFNGSRWRLQVHEDGTWNIAKPSKSDWYPVYYSGNGGTQGIREAAGIFRSIATDETNDAASLLERLADVAESGRAA